MSFSHFRRDSFRVESLEMLRFVEGTKSYCNVNIIHTRGSIPNLKKGYEDGDASTHNSVFMIQKQRSDKNTRFPYYIEIVTSEQFRIYQKKTELRHAYEMVKIRIDFSEILGHDNKGRVLRLVIGKEKEEAGRDYTEDFDDDNEEAKERNEIHVRFQFQHNIFYFLNYLNAYKQETEEKSILIPGPSSKTFYDRITHKRLRERFKRVMKKRKGFLLPVVRVLRNIFQVNHSHSNINDHTLDGRFETFEMKHAGLPFYSKEARIWNLKDFHTWLDHIIVVVDKKKEAKPTIQLNLPPSKKKKLKGGKKKGEEEEEDVVVPAPTKKKKDKKKSKKKGKRGTEKEGGKKKEVDYSKLIKGEDFVLETISTAKKVLEDRGLLKHLTEYFNESKQRNVFMVSLRRDIENHFQPPTPCTPVTPIGPPVKASSIMSSPTIGEKLFEELFEKAEDVMRRIQFHAFILTEYWDQNYNINFFRVLKRVLLNYRRKYFMKRGPSSTFDPKILYDLENSVLLKYRYLWDYKELQQNLMVHILYNQSLENLISNVENTFNEILTKSDSSEQLKNRRLKIEENFLKNPDLVLSPEMKMEFDEICNIPDFWNPQEFEKCFKILHAKYNMVRRRSSKNKKKKKKKKKRKKNLFFDDDDSESDDDDTSNKRGGGGGVINLEKVIVRDSIGSVSLENISYILRNLRVCSNLYHSLINQQDSLFQIFEDRVKNMKFIVSTELKIEKVRKSNNDRALRILEKHVEKEKKRGEEMNSKFGKLKALFLTQKIKVEKFINNMNMMTKNRFYQKSTSTAVDEEHGTKFDDEWKNKEFEYYKNNFHQKSKCLELMIHNELERIGENGTHILEIKYKMILAKKNLMTTANNNKKNIITTSSTVSTPTTSLPDIIDFDVDFKWKKDPYVCYFVFRNIVFYFLENSLIIIDDLNNPKYPISRDYQKTTTTNFTEIVVLDSDCPLVASIHYIGRIMEKFSDHLVLYNSEVEYSDISKFMTAQEDRQLEDSILSSSQARRKKRSSDEESGENNNNKKISNLSQKETLENEPILKKKIKEEEEGGGGEEEDEEKVEVSEIKIKDDDDSSSWDEDDDACMMALLQHSIQKKLAMDERKGSHHHEESLIPKIHMNTQEFVIELLTILSSSPGYPIVQRYLLNLKNIYPHQQQKQQKHHQSHQNIRMKYDDIKKLCDNYSREEDKKNRKKNNPFFVIDPLRYIEVTNEFFRVYQKAVKDAKLKYKRFGPPSLLQHEISSSSKKKKSTTATTTTTSVSEKDSEKKEQQQQQPKKTRPPPQLTRNRSGLKVSSVAFVEDIDEEIESFKVMAVNTSLRGVVGGGGRGSGGGGLSFLDDSSPLRREEADEIIDEEIKKRNEVNEIMKTINESTRKEIRENMETKKLNLEEEEEEEEEVVGEKEKQPQQKEEEKKSKCAPKKRRRLLRNQYRKKKKQPQKQQQQKPKMMNIYRLYFRTHQEIDVFAMVCCQINPLFAKDFQGLWHLLKSFDRAFTMRYDFLEKKKEEKYKKMIEKVEKKSKTKNNNTRTKTKVNRNRKLAARSSLMKKKSKSTSNLNKFTKRKKKKKNDDDDGLSSHEHCILQVVKPDFRGCPFRQMEIMSDIRSIEDDEEYLKKKEEEEEEENEGEEDDDDD